MANNQLSDADYHISESRYGLKINKLSDNGSTARFHLIYSYVNGFRHIFGNEMAKLLLLAGIFRVSTGNAMSVYVIPYFDIYPDQADQFAYVHFFTIIVTSIASNILSGFICDYFERSYYFAKPLICILKGLCGAICCLIIFSVQNNFWLSMTGLFLDYLLSKGW